MYLTTLVTYVNETLAGENLGYSEMQIHLDTVIDEINSTLDSVFPAFSEFNATSYPDRFPDYNFFPDKYLRSVVVFGAAYKFYIMDEEGSYAAPQYERKYQQALFEMKRDYLSQVPDVYKAKEQGYVNDNTPARGLWIGSAFSNNTLAPEDLVSPDLRIYEGRPGRDGTRGPQGKGIQNIWISEDHRIHVRYTDQTTEVVGVVEVLSKGEKGDVGSIGPQGKQGKQGEQGLSGRSLTAMWVDEANQVWVKYDRNYGGVQADTAIRIGQITTISQDHTARAQIENVIKEIEELRESFNARLDATNTALSRLADITLDASAAKIGTIVFDIEDI